MDFGSLASGGLGAAIGGAVTATMVRIWLESRERRIGQLEGRVHELETNHLAHIESRVAKIEGACADKHGRLNETLRAIDVSGEAIRNLVGWTEKIDARLVTIMERTASIQATTDGLRGYIENVDGALKDHRNNREAHR